MFESKTADEMKLNIVGSNLEYVRVRLYLMATLTNFEELVRKKIHFFLEVPFLREFSNASGLSKKQVGYSIKIAKAKLGVLQNKGNKDAEDFYTDLAESYMWEHDISVYVLPQNVKKLSALLNEFNM